MLLFIYLFVYLLYVVIDVLLVLPVLRVLICVDGTALLVLLVMCAIIEMDVIVHVLIYVLLCTSSATCPHLCGWH